MAITQAQKAAAENQQWTAARDGAPQVRLVAGPGTGKSRTIEKRVQHVLDAGADPAEVFVISFTRATCAELTERIDRFLAGGPHAAAALRINVSTMHALALRILRRANLLNRYPSDPRVLDGWEQKHVYDTELASDLNVNRTRAQEIRLAHDAQWQTLDPAYVNQARITPQEVTGFNAFNATRTNLYSCVLPGEVIYACVENYRLGNLNLADIPPVSHLIVDEFQDLNACDQEFIRILTLQGAVLFVAGDDDQSIYSFRHADPSGIVNFTNTYPTAASHDLTDCFRCAPAVLGPASALVAHNQNRLPKNLQALYGNAAPPVPGTMHVWSFGSAAEEAQAIAQSCQQLIAAGMAGRESEILILLAQANPPAVQLNPITEALGNLGIPFSEPSGNSLTEDLELRAVYCVLRLIRDREQQEPDYMAHRGLVSLLDGVGDGTAKALADACVTNRGNFRDLFYATPLPNWLTGRIARAVSRVRDIIAHVTQWTMGDTLDIRINDIGGLLTQTIFTAPGQAAQHLTNWLAFAGTLPQQMTLGELCDYLGSSTTDRTSIIERVNARLGGVAQAPAVPQKVRILTMHGAKGLSGKVVFIPSAAQQVIPNNRSLQAPGLLIEQRRLFYVSITRAMAACIITHASRYTGAAAQALAQRGNVRLTRSQFLNEMGVVSTARTTGLTPQEAAAIVSQVDDL